MMEKFEKLALLVEAAKKTINV